jgi:hypothetical protein
MVVVFPAPFRSEQAEALAGLNLEALPAQGFHFAVVGLTQIEALNSYGHGVDSIGSISPAHFWLRSELLLC